MGVIISINGDSLLFSSSFSRDKTAKEQVDVIKRHCGQKANRGQEVKLMVKRLVCPNQTFDHPDDTGLFPGKKRVDAKRSRCTNKSCRKWCEAGDPCLICHCCKNNQKVREPDSHCACAHCGHALEYPTDRRRLSSQQLQERLDQQ